MYVHPLLVGRLESIIRFMNIITTAAFFGTIASIAILPSAMDIARSLLGLEQRTPTRNAFPLEALVGKDWSKTS